MAELTFSPPPPNENGVPDTIKDITPSFLSSYRNLVGKIKKEGKNRNAIWCLRNTVDKARLSDEIWPLSLIFFSQSSWQDEISKPENDLKNVTFSSMTKTSWSCAAGL